MLHAVLQLSSPPHVRAAANGDIVRCGSYAQSRGHTWLMCNAQVHVGPHLPVRIFVASRRWPACFSTASHHALTKRCVDGFQSWQTSERLTHHCVGAQRLKRSAPGSCQGEALPWS